jgi:cyanate permease
MRTVWVTVLSVWALFAVIAVLAWTRQQPAAPASQGIPTAVVVKGQNGKSRLVVVPRTAAASTHATTRTSPVAAG